MGETDGPDRARPFATLPDGARGRGLRRRPRRSAPTCTASSPTTPSAPPGSPASARAASGLAYEAGVEAALDGLARHLEAHLDLDRLLSLAR